MFHDIDEDPMAMPPGSAAMDQVPPIAYMGVMNIAKIGYIGTDLFTRLRGRAIGRDSFGNRYFEEKAARRGLRARRWVVYAGAVEASAVPPEWHAWLHYTVDAPLSDTGRLSWQKPHLPNRTGTAYSYRPAGHDYSGGRRRPATGDYDSWSPGE